jgi:hypothetical protein
VNCPDVEKPQVQDTTPRIQDIMTAVGRNLSDAESRELEQLLTKYEDIFAMKSDEYERTDRV